MSGNSQPPSSATQRFPPDNAISLNHENLRIFSWDSLVRVLKSIAPNSVVISVVVIGFLLVNGNNESRYMRLNAELSVIERDVLEMRKDIDELKIDVRGIKEDISDLRERVGRLEGPMKP